MTKTFHYTNNSDNLFGGIVVLGAIALIVYGYGVPDFGAAGLRFLLAVLYFGFIAFMFWIAIFQIKTFLRLFGQERLIIIDDQSVTFPEYGDSLNVIRLSFSQIREVYFGKGRHGRAENLIIKYDLNGHAYIQRDALNRHDFEAICNLFKQKLGTDEIELK